MDSPRADQKSLSKPVSRGLSRVITGLGAVSLALFLFAFLFSSCARRAPSQTPHDLSLSAAVERGPDGRVVVTGKAGVPDGTWIYVEITADPEGLGAVWAEAFPVRSGAFAAVTPFSLPLSYHATAVLSGLLNPHLTASLGRLDDRGGVMIRPAGDGKEVVAKAEAAFGTTKEQRESRSGIISDLEKLIGRLKKDLDGLAGDGGKKGLADWHKGFSKRRLGAYAGEGPLVYAPGFADGIDKVCLDLERLFRLRLEEVSENASKEEKAEKIVERARRRIGKMEKRLEDLSSGRA